MSTPAEESRALERVRGFMYAYPIIDRHMTPQQRRVVDDVIAYHAGHVSTHYEDCYRHHAGCLARVLRDLDDQ